MGKPGRGILRCTDFTAPNLCHTRPLQTLFDHAAQGGTPLVPVAGKGLHMGRQLAGQLLMNLTADDKYIASDSGSSTSAAPSPSAGPTATNIPPTP